MNYLVIAEWDEQGHPLRVGAAVDEAAATALVQKIQNEMPEGLKAPDAFYIPDPGIPVKFITVDSETLTATADNAAAQADELAQQWVEVRAKRNQLLSETDWHGMSDLTMSDAWKTYRQALRDVGAQADPNNITWPTKPS